MARKNITNKPRNPHYIRKRTMTIDDKREKSTLNRHKHEMFQAKLLRKELRNVETKDD